MKKLLLSLFVVSLVTVLSSKVVAQYAIPSYDVLIVADPTTFEETSRSSSSHPILVKVTNPFIQKPTSRGEKKIYINTKDLDSGTSASASVVIYSLDGTYMYGPYTVIEGTTYSMVLDDNYRWGVQTISCTEDCEMDVWFD